MLRLVAIFFMTIFLQYRWGAMALLTPPGSATDIYLFFWAPRFFLISACVFRCKCPSPYWLFHFQTLIPKCIGVLLVSDIKGNIQGDLLWPRMIRPRYNLLLNGTYKHGKLNLSKHHGPCSTCLVGNHKCQVGLQTTDHIHLHLTVKHVVLTKCHFHLKHSGIKNTDS